jgi:eukaryotic-like serine/threonine-protein kinase
MAASVAVATSARRLPLSLRIFLLLALMLAATVAVAVAVTHFVGKRIAAEAEVSALALGGEAQNQQTQARLRLLETMIQVVAGDPALVNYVAASLSDDLGLGGSEGLDLASLRDLLLERRSQFGFDLGLVLDVDATLVARSDQPEAFADDFSADPLIGSSLRRLAPQSGFWRLGDRLYQAAVMPLIQGGGLVGFVLLAYQVDDALCRDIARVSDAQVAFWLPGDEGPLLAASSLPADSAQQLRALLAGREEFRLALQRGQPLDRLELDFAGRHWLLSLRPTAVEGESALGGVLSLASGEAIMGGYRQILNLVLLSGLASLVLALPFSFWLSRRSLRPVRQLAEAAEQAAAGNYETAVSIGGRDELASLGRALDSLLSDLREKRDIEGYVSTFSRFVPDAAPAAPAAPAPALVPPRRVEDAILLGVAWPAENLDQDPATAAARVAQRLEQVQSMVRGGRLVAGGGQGGVLLFQGEGAWLAALLAARALLQAWPEMAPALALCTGSCVYGEIEGRRWPLLVGLAPFQLERLLAESAPGSAVLTRSAGEAIRMDFGDGLLQTVTGALSGRRYYGLRAEVLAELRQPETDEGFATVVTPVAGATPAASTSGPQPGDRLGGRYELISVLGEGGMGVVYKARDIELDDVVALKMLKPGALADAEQLERLKDEIRLARKITHPNVLRTFDFGELAGRPFISMEFVRGVTLRDLLKQSGRLPYSAGLRIARQFCAGLAAAHEVGVLHRDIKPENLILEQGGNAKLMDFGIARPVQRSVPGHTQPGMFVGTPLYSAPEQLTGSEVDPRSDIYSTGVMFMEMFCGGLPFGGGNTMEIYMAQLQQEPRRPSEVWPDIPEALEAIILRCVERDPDQRYQSAAELGAAISELRA